MPDGPTEPASPVDLPRELAAEILAVCRQRVGRFQGLSRGEQEDAAQQAVTRVLEALAEGHVTHVAAFARRVAFHCAVDAWRRAHGDTPAAALGRAVESRDADVPAPASSAAPTPEELSAEKRRMERLAGVAHEVRALLDAAPENYRRVLVGHYFEGRSLDALAHDELARRHTGAAHAQSAGHDDELQRARNAVHAWHSRALRWLQARAPDGWKELLS